MIGGREPGTYQRIDPTLRGGGQPAPRHRRSILERLLDLIDEYISGAIDTAARQRGLTVHRKPGTRIHVYRHPMWDRRHECADCGGTGVVGANECAHCEGIGVVTLPASDEAGDAR